MAFKLGKDELFSSKYDWINYPQTEQDVEPPMQNIEPIKE